MAKNTLLKSWDVTVVSVLMSELSSSELKVLGSRVYQSIPTSGKRQLIFLNKLMPQDSSYFKKTDRRHFLNFLYEIIDGSDIESEYTDQFFVQFIQPKEKRFGQIFDRERVDKYVAQNCSLRPNQVDKIITRGDEKTIWGYMFDSGLVGNQALSIRQNRALLKRASCTWHYRHLAKRSLEPEKVFSTVLEENEGVTNIALAKNIHTSSDMLSDLFRSGNSEYAMAVLENPSCPPKILSEVLNQRSDPHLLSAAVCNPALTLKDLKSVLEMAKSKKYGSDSESFLEKAIVEHPSCTAGILEKLYDDYAKKNLPYFLLGKMLSSPKLTKEILIKIAKRTDNSDSSMEIWEAILANPNCPVANLEGYYENGLSSAGKYAMRSGMGVDWGAQIRVNVLEREDCPQSVLIKEAGHSNSEIRCLVASSTQADSHVFKQFLKERSQPVIDALLSNPNCPEEILDMVTKPKSKCTLESAYIIYHHKNATPDIKSTLDETYHFSNDRQRAVTSLQALLD